MVLPKKYLYLLAALIWGAPGVSITTKGFGAYLNVSHSELWWLLLITMGITIFFFWIFRRVSKQYIERIATLPDRSGLHQTFPLKGWILILFMIGLGITLKYTPNIPIQFTASFYSGLGPMLVLSAIRFLSAMIHRQHCVVINLSSAQGRKSLHPQPPIE